MELTEFIFGKVIIPLAYYVRGDIRFWYYNKYMKHMNFTRKQTQEYQLDRLQSLVKHAYTTVPYYKKLFDKLSIKPADIKTLEDYKKIPALDKETVIKSYKQLRSTKKYKGVEMSSGGSTGNRVVVFKDKRYYEISRAVWMRDLASLGILTGQRVAWMWGSELENAPIRERFLNRLLWKLNRRITFNTFSYSDVELENWLTKEYNRFRPKSIIGYADPLYQIARFIRDNKLKVHSPEIIISTAERLEHRKEIEKIFGCKVIDLYGCREITIIALEDLDYNMHSSDDFVHTEVDNDGNIMITPLESYGMVLLRYKNGDIGKKAVRGNRKDMHPFSRLDIEVGRDSEMLVRTNGKKLMSPFIGFLAAEAKLNVGEYQVVQKSLRDIDLNIVKGKQFRQGDVSKLKAIIVQLLGDVDVTVNYVKKYPLETSGKKLAYKCLIKNGND